MWKTQASIIALALGCSSAQLDVGDTHGNAELGVIAFQVSESDSQLEVVGIDADGETVARLALRVGHVELPEDQLAGPGRTLKVRVHGLEEAHASVGLSPLALPETDSVVDVFLRDPFVADALARWNVELAVAAPSVFGGPLDFTHPGTCTSFVPPCQGTPFTSCCLEHPKSIGGFEDVRNQYVVCGNLSPKTRAIRNCKGAGAVTACGTAGPAGCAVCWSASYAARPNYGARYDATGDACGWQVTDFLFLHGLTEQPAEQDARKPDVPPM